MKPKISLLVGAVAFSALAVSCVKTVNDRHTGAIPFFPDKAQARYERPVAQVFEAAKTVVARNGVVSRETSLLGCTNAVRCLEGRVNQRAVWIRVEEIDPRVTALTIQARTNAGGTDQSLTHELDKQIALELVR
jgi:hypothetical protein